MATIFGATLKKTNPGPYLKWLRSDMNHNGFRYSPGLNIDFVKFNPTGSCEPGGLHLMKNIKNLTEFYNYGPILGIFDIPDDAQVYLEDESVSKFKCEKVILLKTVTSDVDLVDYFEKAKENSCFLSSDTSEHAASSGHLEVLKWLRENGCPWDSWTCAYAALNGHLEILKWLRENGCPWNAWTSSYAAANGHLEILKWVHQNGCPFNYRTYSYPSANGHPEVLNWLKENGLVKS